MKTIIGLMALMISFSSFAADFIIKMEDVTCTISKGVVTRTQKVGVASFTEKKNVTINGIDELVTKVAEVSSQLPANQEEEYIHQMIVDGKTYTLNLKDSKESVTLIRLTSRMCR